MRTDQRLIQRRAGRWTALGALLLQILGPVGPAASRDDLVLAENGVARCTIMVPNQPDSFTRMAASWLAEYVRLTCGAVLPIVEESAGPQGTLISVGATDAAAAAGVYSDGLQYDGCRMVSRGDVLYLIGRDSGVRKGAVLEPEEGPWLYHFDIAQSRRALGAGAKGTCRAVTAFLENFCGIRWLAPARWGVHLPTRERLAVPPDLDATITPAFAFAIGNAFYGSQLSRPAAYANTVRSAVRMRHYGGHSYIHWLPSGLFKEHPEYFVLHNGSRSSAGHHVCPSNPEVRRMLLRGLQAEFDAGYDWVELGQSDGHIPCECTACRRMDEDASRRMLLLHQWICREAAKTHPDKTVLLIAYGPTSRPHPDIRFGSNVVIELTGGRPDVVERWTGYGRGMAIYHYWFDLSLGMGFGPRMTPREASEIVRYYHEQGVLGVFGGGGWGWGLMGPTYYTLGRMMGDPSRDVRLLVTEYCEGLFGSAAAEMQSFFDLLYSRSYWDLSFRHGLSMTIDEAVRYLYPPQFVRGLDERLRAAEGAAVSERATHWIRMTRDEFDYLRHMSDMLHLYAAYLGRHDPLVGARLKESVDRFNAYRRRVVCYEGDRITDCFPGHGFLAKYLSTGANSGYYYGAWRDMRLQTDFDRLDASGIGYREGQALNLPLTLDFDALDEGRPFRVARAVHTPQIDGELSTAEWQHAQPTIFKSRVATEVRGLYDDENLYVAFRCEEPHIDRVNVTDMYRDADVSLVECVELMLSPESSEYATRYYHILAAPGKDALLDLRTGFRGERDQDESWNAEGLKFAYRIDRANRTWCIEMLIPFRDIHAAPPRPGDGWMGNLARERRVEALELQLWSQGGSGGFTDPRSFGRFLFE